MEHARALPLIIGPLMAAAGFALWTTFAVAPLVAGGRLREAWDIETYWIIGLPLLLLAQAAAGFFSQASPWRLALWCAAGHFLAALIIVPGGTSFSMLPFALVFIGLPMFAALTFAAFIGRWLGRMVME